MRDTEPESATQNTFSTRLEKLQSYCDMLDAENRALRKRFQGSPGDDPDAMRQVRAALHESETRNRAILAAIPDMIFVCDRNGVYLDFHAADTHQLLVPPEQFIGKSICEFHVPDVCDRLIEAFGNVLRTGRMQEISYVLDLPEGRRHFETRITRMDAERTLSIVRDITEQKQHDVERQRLLVAIEQAAEMVVLTDPEGTILYVNPAFERITGYTHDEAIGQNPRFLKSGRQDNDFYRRMWDTLTAGQTWEGRFVNRRKDGSLYHESAIISPVLNECGERVHYVACKSDITRQLENEAMLQFSQRMESVGRLAGGIAHDYNNMLQVIIGAVEMAHDRVPDASPIQEDLEQIRKAAWCSADIIRQLLTFARKQNITPHVLDVNAVIPSTLNMLQRSIGRNITLEWKPGTDLWPIRMDPAQVDQMLANLCINARDAIDAVGGNGTITVETANHAIPTDEPDRIEDIKTGDYVRLSIRDTGCGMDEETRNRIFEPFFTTKETGRGTGLGLPMVYGIATQNGGCIHVGSRPGEGTVFHIYLPRYTGSEKPDPVPQATPAPRSGGETLLVVDDEECVIRTVERTLRKQGYQVLTAFNADEALAFIRDPSRRIDLLLSDIAMPEMTGWELLGQVNRLAPEIKCLLMSGYSEETLPDDFPVSIASWQLLLKPFSREELLDKVNRVLQDGFGEPPCPTTGHDALTPTANPLAAWKRLTETQRLAIRTAVEDGDMPQLRERIADLHRQAPVAARELSDLAGRYDYERILTLTDKAER